MTLPQSGEQIDEADLLQDARESSNSCSCENSSVNHSKEEEEEEETNDNDPTSGSSFPLYTQPQSLPSSTHTPLQQRPRHEKELHIAPMLNVSKREFRKLFSILSTKVVLWTDMIVDTTIAHSDKLQDVVQGDMDVPNVQICQIGGNSPELCAMSTKVVQKEFGYSEVNLNIDCPSDRVSLEREFGAVLMKQADVAYNVVQAMTNAAIEQQQQQQQQDDDDGDNNDSGDEFISATRLPISIKCRVGVDDWDDYEFIAGFVQRLHPVCRRFYLHARKCCLQGIMTARQNRSIPPLNFPRVYDICRQFPDCDFWINGGIRTLDHAKAICFGSTAIQNSTDMNNTTLNHHAQVHDHHQVPCASCQYSNGSCTAPPIIPPDNLRGCMMGRAAMDNPAIFADADRYFYGLPHNPCQNRRQVFQKYCQYLEELYPRRCCDDQDDVLTYKLPVPNIRAKPGQYCPICQPMYLPNGTTESADSNHPTTTITESTMITRKMKTKKKPKIASRLIGRALIPIRGMFFGLPKSKLFNKRLDDLGRDLRVRDCGPGYIIRKALEVVPDYVLDQEFATSEEYSCQRFH